jgi:ComF family protein
MHQFFTDISGLVFDTLFPIYCLSCKSQASEYYCADCVKKLSLVLAQACLVCRKPSLAGFTHPGCRNSITPNLSFNLYDYHDKNISKGIILGKYKFITKIYKQLGIELALTIKQQFDFILNDIDYIVPIPLARLRQRWRGFNQAEILAEKLSLVSEIQIMKLLLRKKNTKTQKDLPQEARFKNMRGAFGIAPNIEINGKNIILIDDVCTTGATLRQAVKTLKQAGANKVNCITLAAD